MMHPAPPSAAACRAVVTAGSLETEYLRAGRGACVVYLALAPDDDPARGAMFAGLASRFRVYAPTSASLAALRSSEGADALCLARWLSGFLEGLGILRASLVVEGALGGAAGAFAELQPSPVERVVVLDRDDGPVSAVLDFLSSTG